MGLDIVSELERLLDMLRGGRALYALCGGFAVGIHGHVRARRNVDLLVSLGSLPEIAAILERVGFDVASGPIPFSAGTPNERVVHRFTKLDDGDALSVDVLLATSVLMPVWATRVEMDWNGRTVSVVSRDGLARMKRLAGRHKDLADLEDLGIS